VFCSGARTTATPPAARDPFRRPTSKSSYTLTIGEKWRRRRRRPSGSAKKSVNVSCVEGEGGGVGFRPGGSRSIEANNSSLVCARNVRLKPLSSGSFLPSSPAESDDAFLSTRPSSAERRCLGRETLAAEETARATE